MKVLPIAMSLAFASCAHNSYTSNQHKLIQAVHNKERSDESRQRDVYRHPLETLEFFEVKPNQNVVEISPSGGWYTDILAPLLQKDGKLTLAIFDDNTKTDYKKRLNKKIKDKYPNLTYTTFDAPEYLGPIAPENSVDRVLTFRNIHNWMKEGKLNNALSAFYKALKTGGILGIVDHRASMNHKLDTKASDGYVREDYLIKTVEAAGFEFVAKSEVNANYRDTTDHPKGVWTLPPSLRLKDKDKFKYLSIGESDRMTLKFRKK